MVIKTIVLSLRIFALVMVIPLHSEIWSKNDIEDMDVYTVQTPTSKKGNAESREVYRHKSNYYA